jgi:hypothetical protein
MKFTTIKLSAETRAKISQVKYLLEVSTVDKAISLMCDTTIEAINKRNKESDDGQ